MSWNRGAERMFGYTAGEAIGKSIRMIVPADRQPEEDKVLGRIRAGESVNHFETEPSTQGWTSHTYLAHGVTDSRRDGPGGGGLENRA